MNTPNPLIPQGTFPDNRGRSHVRIAVFAILAVHVVLLGGLLMLGCRKPTEDTTDKATNTTYAGSFQPPTSVYETPTNPLPPPPTNPVANNTITPPPTNYTPVAPPSAPPESEKEHVVVKGDSFFTIGKKYGVSTKAIQEANQGVDSTRLKIGQKLKIPASSGSTARSGLSGGGASVTSEKTYVVKSGDNLMKIAKANGTTAKALRSANALKTDQIKVGQKLKIPSKAAAPIADTFSTTPPPPTTPAATSTPP